MLIPPPGEVSEGRPGLTLSLPVSASREESRYGLYAMNRASFLLNYVTSYHQQAPADNDSNPPTVKHFKRAGHSLRRKKCFDWSWP